DVEPLLVNAIQPNDPRLKVSTTGLCYATGDVYTIESRGIVRTESGSEVASSLLREIVEVSAPEPLRLGLFSQADYQSELFLSDPYESPLSPEDHAHYAIGFPGIRSHLVNSTPLLLRSCLVEGLGGGILGTGKAASKRSLLKFPIAGGE